jgi:hypothetical protein
MKRKYIRLINPFLSSYRRNYKAMEKQATTNYDALNANKANQLIHERFALTEPVYQSFKLQYALWYNAQGISSGGTKGFNDLVEEIPAKLKLWQHKIVDVYDETTVEFKTLFPKGRNDMYRGNQGQQIGKLTSFELELAKYPSLQLIYNEVKSFNVQLDIAFKDKGVKHDTKDSVTTELDTAHDNMGEMLFSNMLRLTDIFIKNTEVVENYFDFSLLRSAPKQDEEASSYVLHVAENSKALADVSFSPDDVFMVGNNSSVSAFCYGAATPDAPIPASLIEIPAGEEIEVTALSLGAPNNKYLIFVNKDLNVEVEVEIMLMQ